MARATRLSSGGLTAQWQVWAQVQRLSPGQGKTGNQTDNQTPNDVRRQLERVAVEAVSSAEFALSRATQDASAPHPSEEAMAAAAHGESLDLDLTLDLLLNTGTRPPTYPPTAEKISHTLEVRTRSSPLQQQVVGYSSGYQSAITQSTNFNPAEYLHRQAVCPSATRSDFVIYSKKIGHTPLLIVEEAEASKADSATKPVCAAVDSASKPVCAAASKPVCAATQDARGALLECAAWMKLEPHAPPHNCNKFAEDDVVGVLETKNEKTSIRPGASWLSGLAEVAAAHLVSSLIDATCAAPDSVSDEDDRATDEPGTFSSVELQSAMRPKAEHGMYNGTDTDLSVGRRSEKPCPFIADKTSPHHRDFFGSYTDFWFHLYCCVYTGLPATAAPTNHTADASATHLCTPEVSEFLSAIAICENLALWDELEQYLTNKRFLQGILVWRDLSHSVSQALTIYSVALSRYDGAGIKAQALRTTAEQLHKIRLEIVADTSGSSRGKSITLLVASLRRSALGAVALQGEDTRAEDVSIDLPSVSGSEEGENDSFASLGEYDSDVSLSKSPALSKSRETLRATPRSPRSPTLNAPSAKNISKIIRSQNTPGSLAQTSLVAASQISSFFRRVRVCLCFCACVCIQAVQWARRLNSFFSPGCR